MAMVFKMQEQSMLQAMQAGDKNFSKATRKVGILTRTEIQEEGGTIIASRWLLFSLVG